MIEKETLALESLAVLMKDAEHCRMLFDDAHMDYPAPLRRMLGISIMTATPRVDEGGGPLEQGTSAGNGAEAPPTGPERIGPGQISVPIAQMTPQTLALAILAASDGPLPVKTLLHEIGARGVKVRENSLANMMSRLAGRNLIRRSKEGWSVTFPEKAPKLNGTRAYGEPEVFTVHELAARRREVLEEMLSLTPGGLRATDIADKLANDPALGTPASLDLVKTDLKGLQEAGKVHRREGSRQWVSGPKEEHETLFK